MALEFLDEPTEAPKPTKGRLRFLDVVQEEVTPEAVAKALKPPSGSLEEPRVNFMRESVGGIRDITEGAKELGRGYPVSLGKLGGGALRFLGAPAAPALDWAGRMAGTSLQDLLRRAEFFRG